MRRIFVAVGICCLVLDIAVAQATDNEVDVFGYRTEHRRQNRPGHSTIIRPSDASRFDTTTQLSREPSLTIPETGRINASGFAVPRVRGQDARLTEIYLDDLLLQDPYSGLPFMDDLDLRAFGELALFQGLPPPELSSLNPVGVLQYRLKPINASRVSAGGSVGQPHGTSTWFLADAAPGIETTAATFRAYARQHQTDGRYRYYDNNTTPYNSSDDTYRTRNGNDRRAQQFMPFLRLASEHDELLALGLWANARTGLPAAQTGASAREFSTTNLGLIRWRHSFSLQPALWPDALQLSVAASEDGRRTNDPEQEVIGALSNSRLKIASRRTEFRLIWQGDTLEYLAAGVETARADVHTHSDVQKSSQHLQRESLAAHIALRHHAPWLPITTEFKALSRWQHSWAPVSNDQMTPQIANPSKQAIDTHAIGTSLGWRWSLVTAYVQSAFQTRSPALIEQFGDGGRIRGQPGLKPESIRHHELGLRLRDRRDLFNIGMAAFNDFIGSKIVFIPSLGSSLRAHNVAKTATQGWELYADARPTPATHLLAGYTRLFPYDLTVADRPRLLPSIPEQVGVLGIEQRLAIMNTAEAALRWQARYQSQVYRDLDNSIIVPAYWVHNVSADSTWSVGVQKLELGISLLNVFDVTRLPIEAPATQSSQGYTSYSDVDGYPLPGRQWRLQAAISF